MKLLGLCNVCLHDGHFARTCSAQCCSCGGRHHSLLHNTKTEKSKTKVQQTSDNNKTTEMTNLGSHGTTSSATAFMTVKATIEAGPSEAQATVLLDSGSSCSYITEHFANQLNLQGELQSLETVVLGGGTMTAERQLATIAVRHADQDSVTPVKVWIIPQITSTLEYIDWSEEQIKWPHLNGIQLPDTKSEENVDVLIGLDAPDLHVSLEERMSDIGNGPVARRTALGWICFGQLTGEPVMKNSHQSYMSKSSADDDELTAVVKRFWTLESVGMNPVAKTYLSPDEKEAEASTMRTLTYNGERFEVGIPWKTGKDSPVVSCDQSMAFQRLASLHRTFNRKPDIQLQYTKVLESYLEKGYIQLVKAQIVEEDGCNQWFLPHFPVVREDKVTTKVRLVFDGSARFNGVSINDLMHVGPKLQNDLLHILLRFCLWPIAVAADVSEMFLQVSLREADRRYHRFLWSKSPNDPAVVYEFCRVVFGMRASPYLAGRAIKATAEKFEHNFASETQRAIDESLYVDDLLHSSKTVENAVQLRQEIQQLLQQGGFHIRKWICNSSDVMSTIPPAEHAPNSSRCIVEHDDPAFVATQKTLGVSWSAEHDYFTFMYPEPEDIKFTKRGVLSQMCRLFDPRGQLCPFTIRSRVLFQDTCVRGKSWDKVLDDDQQVTWKKWFTELPDLADIAAPRCFTRAESLDDPLELHTFCDASESAYAAAVYVRHGLRDSEAKVSLAAAKARPSPIQRKTIPILELQGGVLGVRLSRSVGDALAIPKERQYFWSDSMNVLYWVKSPSRKFKIEIGNRVSEIQDASASYHWNHIPGKQNPADKATRGISAAALTTDQEWWCGPDFLSKPDREWPQKSIIVPSELPGQLKKTFASTFLSQQTSSGFKLQHCNYSSMNHLVRVTAWCLRFIRHMKKQQLGKREDISDESSVTVTVAIPATKKSLSVQELTCEELDVAETFWISRAQHEVYGNVFAALKSKKPLTGGAPLAKLNPVLDTVEGIEVLRVGGRLSTSHHLPQSLRHPIILPPRHHVTSLVIEREDTRCGHAVGPNHILSNLSLKYWLVKGKTVVREHLHHCVRCKRVRRKAVTPLMGPLPEFRTEGPLLAFSKVAVDFAGPFLTKQGRGRNQQKRYVCIFTCLQSRACHLEVVNSLDTDGFLMAFTRFSKRRGTPTLVVSDNGSNFVAAERELREALDNFDQRKIASQLAVEHVKWMFNPPKSPHFGGVVESMVKCVKRALWNVLHQASLSDEELMTALVHAEWLVNSRPLTTISSDPADPSPLTPAHFLIGRMAGVTALEASMEELERAHPRRRWQVIQVLARQIWKRWIKEIVPNFNVRTKWYKDEGNVSVGDVFIVLDEHTPCATWPLGRVVSVYPGKDGIVRAVDVKVSGKTYRRSVHCLVPLDVSPAKDKSSLPRTAGIDMLEVCS